MKRNRYTKQSLIKAVQSVVDYLGYFPSEKEYRSFRKGKNLPMPKVTKSVFGLTWSSFGKKFFNYTPISDKAPVEVPCANCHCLFCKERCNITKTRNNFCSRSCAATYNNKHKKYGTRRSKSEKWLESQLTKLYPNLYFSFNDKSAIGSELDIFIPSLNLAFEINGIFHYKPIYGKEKFNKILINDRDKVSSCKKNHIELVVINTSDQKKFSPQSSKKYLDQIKNHINRRVTEGV